MSTLSVYRLGQHTSFAPQLPFRRAIPSHTNAPAEHSAIFTCDTFKHLTYFISFYCSFCTLQIKVTYVRSGQLKCDGTRAETRFHLSAKRTSPFKSAGTSVQSTTGSRGVRISGSNAGYTMFGGGVKGTGYPLHSPVSPSLPLPCVTVCHHISTGVYFTHWYLLQSTPHNKNHCLTQVTIRPE